VGRGDDVERAEERLRVLTSAMRTFAEATTDLAHLLDAVARNVAEVLGDACVLLILTEDGERLAPAAAYAVDPDALARVHALVKTDPFLLRTHPTARAVLETRTAMLVPHIDPATLRGQTTSAYAAFQQEQGIHSLLAVALHSQGRSLGLLTLTRYRPTSPAFDVHDRDLALNLADHASLAIVNARLYVAERTARLAAEEAMRSRREAEARFARLADVGLLGILVSRLDGSIVDVNPYLENLLGVSRHALVSGAVPWSDLTPPEWNDVDACARQQLLATGAGALREKEFVRADGTRVPVLIGSARVADGPDILSFILDLSDRKRAEASLARLHADRVVDARFRVVLEAAPDAIIVTDARRRITFVNGQAERLVGYSRAELHDAPLALLIPERSRAEASELTGRRKDGTEFALEITESPLETDEGPLVVSALRDITKRRRAERVVLRAKAAAESANRELEAFSYSVAHDLRAPLRAVTGFAQILLEDHASELDEAGSQLTRKIVGGAHKMGALIDGLLGLARLNRMEPKRQATDLSAVARASLTQALRDEANAARPPTAVVIEDGLWVEADPTLLQAMVDNLVANAVKFTGRTAAPRIELGRIEHDGERVFFVRDNGAGFDMQYANKLFAPFQRLHRTSDFVGTGIGLATVQRIVARHEGRIWAEAQVGAGATFYFTLPARASVERAGAERSPSAE
jgi:PAS domain S-box-containing protein